MFPFNRFKRSKDVAPTPSTPVAESTEGLAEMDRRNFLKLAGLAGVAISVPALAPPTRIVPGVFVREVDQSVRVAPYEPFTFQISRDGGTSWTSLGRVASLHKPRHTVDFAFQTRKTKPIGYLDDSFKCELTGGTTEAIEALYLEAEALHDPLRRTHATMLRTTMGSHYMELNDFVPTSFDIDFKPKDGEPEQFEARLDLTFVGRDWHYITL